MDKQRTSLESREAGFSFIEATIASVLLVSLAGLVASLTRSGATAQQFSQRLARVTEISQDLADQIRTGLSASVRILGSGTEGDAYRSMCQLPDEPEFSMPQPIQTSRLPVVRTNGHFDLEDASQPVTGNDLMFARYSWTYEYEVSSGDIYRVDVYRLERYYMTPAGDGPQQGSPVGLNFVHWVSEPLADGAQIDSIADSKHRDEILTALFDAEADRFGVTRTPVQVLWTLGASISDVTTLRQIFSDGSTSNDSQAPRSTTWEFEADPDLCQPNMLDYRHHSIATVFSPVRMGANRFGLVDETSDGFPHGFEIQVIGPSSSREILVHLTIVSTRGDGQRAFHDLQVVSDIRDV
ncbi:MAG: hypothetical protein AAF196_02090 [Planctomycetota bacterium]